MRLAVMTDWLSDDIPSQVHLTKTLTIHNICRAHGMKTRLQATAWILPNTDTTSHRFVVNMLFQVNAASQSETQIISIPACQHDWHRDDTKNINICSN